MSLIFTDGYGGVSPEEFNEAIDELQQQIDTLEAASDVTDVVGTYSELQSYDTSKLTDKDIIKVLSDSTHNDAIAYYRWSTSTESFTYIGSEGPYATISYVNTTFAKPTDIKDGVLTVTQNSTTLGSFSSNQSSNTTIDIPTPNNAALTLTQNGTTLGSFGANASSDVTIDIAYPSVMTGATSSTVGTSGLVPAPAAGDDTKFLSGAGTYESVSVDLSTYATKTDLNAKQNILSPNSPLTISEYIINNLQNFTYTAGGVSIYSSNESRNTYPDCLHNVSENYLEGARFEQGGQYDATCARTEENFWSMGYIDVPYSLGQIVGGGQATVNASYPLMTGEGNIIFGKYANNSFVPIAVSRSGNSYRGWIIYTTDIGTYSSAPNANYKNIYYMPSVSGTKTYGTSGTVASIGEEKNRGYYGSLAQIVDNETSISIHMGAGSYFFTTTTSDATLYSRLKEVTVARIVPLHGKGDRSAYPFLVKSIGLWNSGTALTASVFSASENTLGTNLFDISGATAHTYLDLHIGTGLAVSNGNLVNSNPTAPSIATSAIVGLVKPDETTIHVDSTGVLSTINMVKSTSINNILPISASDYSDLEQAGTVDAHTLYLIVNVVS